MPSSEIKHPDESTTVVPGLPEYFGNRSIPDGRDTLMKLITANIYM